MDNNIIKNKKRNILVITIRLLFLVCLICAVVGFILKDNLTYRNTYPDFTKGYDYSDASYFSGINELQFETIYVDDERPEYTILSQSIKPGEKVNKGEHFAVTVSSIKIDNDNDNDKISEWINDVEQNDNEIIVTVLCSLYGEGCKKYKPIIKKLVNENHYKLYYFEIKNLNSDDYNKVVKKYDLNLNMTEKNMDVVLPYTFATKNNVVFSQWGSYLNEEYIKSNVEDLKNKSKNKVVNIFEKTIDFNGNSVNIKFLCKINYKETIHNSVYTKDIYENWYTLKFNNDEVWGVIPQTNYCENYLENNGTLEYVKDLKIVKGKDNKDYLTVNIDFPEESGVEHQLIVLNTSGIFIFDFVHSIPNYFYELKGPNDKNYLINQNECNTYFSESLCNSEHNLYSLYKIDKNKINMLYCDDDANDITEYIIEFNNDKVFVEETKNKYYVSNIEDLTGDFTCPSYTSSE